MSGNKHVDQCPFCNAIWGDCPHVQLLMELENEAIIRAAHKHQVRDSDEPSVSPVMKAQSA